MKKIAFWCLFTVNMLQGTTLEKFYEHLGQSADKIVFYFKQAPKMQHTLVPLHDAPEFYRSEKFIFTDVQFGSAEIRKLLHNFQAYHKKLYRLKFKKIKAGLELVLVYDVRSVHCVQCHRFKAISGFAGLVLKIEHAAHKKMSLVPEINNLTVADLNQHKNVSKIKLVLDYGHGGTDYGATGVSPQPEKVLTRLVGIKLKSLLEELGFIILETRSGDETVALDDRTTFANHVGDVAAFISLHANHASNVAAAGIEIYYADDHLLDHVALNSLATVCKFSLQGALSKALAEAVLSAMVYTVREHATRDRKVRCSMSQVLLGVENMLAILIEMGYLSNQHEADLLNNDQYQWKLARGIAKGIKQYFARTS